CGDAELPAVLAEVEVPGDPASYPVPLVFVPLEQAAGSQCSSPPATARTGSRARSSSQRVMNAGTPKPSIST
ncbi:hypothetical protein R0G64_31465, partial [Pseudomonas otitidis]